MKITFLSDDFPPHSFGGAGISTYDLALGMKKAGHDVTVITTCRLPADAGELTYNGLKIFRIGSNYSGKWRWYVSLNNRRVVRQVADILKKIQPDVVHVNNVHFYLSYRSILVAKKIAKVVVWTGRDVMAFNFSKLQTPQYLHNFDYRTTWHDHIKQAKKRWNPLRNFFIKKYLAYPDKLFAVSAALRDALAKNGIPNAEVVHTGADLSEWNVTEAAVALFKAKHKLEGKQVVLFGGRLSEAKGGKQVMEAFVEIAKEFPGALLLVVAGIDGHTEQMKKEAATLGIENRLVFTGWIGREEMKAAYGSSDIVLLPSVCFDSFPRVALEAMAMGRPVIGTCFGGASEIIQDGITGYVINPLKVNQIIEKVGDLLRNPARAKEFGVMSRKRVETDFDQKDKVEYLVSQYRTLLDKQNGI